MSGRVKNETEPFSHLSRSVSWWRLIAVLVGITSATCISVLIKDPSKSARWCQSSISLDASVATYILFTGKNMPPSPIS